jgi:hypothetical protein
MHLLAPWSEGNFSDCGQKTYLLPRGSVDEGEGFLEAAIREVAEETGVYLDEVPDDPRPEHERRYIYDPSNARHHKWEEEGRDCFYPGVQVKRWLNDGKPLSDGYVPTNRGNPAKQQMFGVELTGIKALDAPGVLKHGFNGAGGPEVTLKARGLATEKVKQGELPSFKELLNVLRTGHWEWGDKPEMQGWLFDPDAGVAERSYLYSRETAALKASVAQLTQRDGWSREDLLDVVNEAVQRFEDVRDSRLKIETPEEFDVFFRQSAIQNTIKDHLKLLRKHMEGRHLPEDQRDAALLSDTSGLKMDTRQRPMRYYQEGADIIPAVDYLQRMVDFNGTCNDEMYTRSQFSPVIHDRKPGRQHLEEHVSTAEVALGAVEQMLKDTDEKVPMALKEDIRRLTREQAAARSAA